MVASLVGRGVCDPGTRIGGVVTPPLESADMRDFSENVIASESECSTRRRLMEAALRDKLRIVLRRRGLPPRGLKEDLIKRLLPRQPRLVGSFVVSEVSIGASDSALLVRQALNSVLLA